MRQFNLAKSGLSRGNFLKTCGLVLSGLFFKSTVHGEERLKTYLEFSITKNILIPSEGQYEINVYNDYVQLRATLKSEKGKLLSYVCSRAMHEKYLEKNLHVECKKLSELAVKLAKTQFKNSNIESFTFVYPSNYSQIPKIS